MRIAQVSPLAESVPPRQYGGTERVVHYLTEELVRQGHDVTLYASGDSRTRGRLRPCCGEALRLAGSADPLAHHLVMLERVARELADYDIVHFHVDYLHFPFSRRHRIPHLTTLHGRLDIPDLEPLYREYPDMPVVSISDSQRKPLPWLNWQGTVYHGMPVDRFQPVARPEGYLAFLGRVSPEKGLDQAIRIAVAAGRELRIAAKIGREERPYFEDVIEPLLGAPGVRFIGEIGDEEKNDFLGRAAALLFPIDWDEPFGMVMMEAMACGTPVIAYGRGSVPEVIRDGVSGFVLPPGDLDAAVAAVAALGSFDRARCRRDFEERFSVERMTRDYLRIYQQVLDHRRPLKSVQIGGLVR